MRALTAILLLSAALGPLGCANRGMQAPDGGPGAGGTVGTGGRGGQSGTAGRGGGGGTGGGVAGTSGVSGSGGAAGASCNIPTDAGAAGGTCTAMFNFETDTQGAMINTGSTAFKSLAQSGAFTFCGNGALAIDAAFSGSMGSTIKGEVLIPLPGAPVDLTNKMITVHVASDPGCSDLSLSLVVNTQSGPIYFTPTFPIRSVTNSWKMATATVTADGGATTALNLSLQAFSTMGYTGTIYIDEIDVK